MSTTVATESAFEIEPARSTDDLAVRLLLPVIDYSVDPPAGFVAVIGSPRRVVGAAVAWCRPVVGVDNAVPCAVRVAGPWQRFGIGHALIDVLSTEVRGWGVASLCSYSKVKEGGAIHTAWQGLGFAPSPWVSDYDADPRVMAQRSKGLLAWCVETGRVPSDGRVRPASVADAAAMSVIECAALGGIAWQVRQRLQKQIAEPSSRTLVVEQGDNICGFCLSLKIDANTWRIDTHVIDPSYRADWPEAMLRHHFFELSAAEGIEHLLFSASDREPNTRNLARRARAAVLARRATMVLSR